ncbi:MAG: malonic semialdehyde reductase [Rhodospirillales bacterium]|nr:malonic semialdehyde reductase [Rhodospirillales bacterium]
MSGSIDSTALEQLFNEARTHSSWLNMPVKDEQLKQAWDLAKMGPTAVNCSPTRIVFVRSPEAKERLKPCLSEGNVEKTMAAPATAIIGHDMAFYNKLDKLTLSDETKLRFIGKPALIDSTAYRNGTLQGAYLILACRALGLDCGPMSGFDPIKTESEFFPEQSITPNFMCNIGYGDSKKLKERRPRLDFEEACSIV